MSEYFIGGGSDEAVPESEDDDSRLFMHTLLVGGVIKSAAMAQSFGELVLTGLHGADELARQHPLQVTDQGPSWLVEGSFQEPDAEPGTLSWFMITRKSDAKVMNIGHRFPMNVPDDVKQMIASAKSSDALRSEE